MKNKSLYISLIVLVLFFSADVFADQPVSINETLANITCPSQISVMLTQEVYNVGDTFSFDVFILDDNGKPIPNQRFYVLITGPDLTDRGGHQTDENGDFSYEAVIDGPIETGEYKLTVYIDSEYCSTEIQDIATFTLGDLTTQTCGDNFCSADEAAVMCKVNMCTCPIIEPCAPGTACTQPVCECQETCEVICPQDCLPSCGNRVCEDVTCTAKGCPLGENAQNCPVDCAEKSPVVIESKINKQVLSPGEKQKLTFEVNGRDIDFVVSILTPDGIEIPVKTTGLTTCNAEEQGFCIHTAEFYETHTPGKYIINVITEEPIPIKGNKVFIVEDYSVLSKYLILKNIGDYVYQESRVESFDNDRPAYMATYTGMGKDIAVAVIDFGSKQEVNEFIQDRLDDSGITKKETVLGYPVYIYESGSQRVFFWSRKTSVIAVIESTFIPEPAQLITETREAAKTSTTQSVSSDVVNVNDGPQIKIDQDIETLTPQEIVSIIEEHGGRGLITGHAVTPATEDTGTSTTSIELKDYPYDLLQAYLNKYPSDNGAIGTECEQHGGICVAINANEKPIGFEPVEYACKSTLSFCYIKQVDSDDFMDMAFKLENMKIRLIEFQKQADVIKQFYLEHGYQGDVERYEEIDRLFSDAMNIVDSTKQLVRENLDNPHMVKTQVKENLIYVKDILRRVAMLMLSEPGEPVGDVEEIPVSVKMSFRATQWTSWGGEDIIETHELDVEKGTSFGFTEVGKDFIGTSVFEIVKILDENTVQVMFDEDVLVVEGDSINNPAENSPITISNEKCFNTKTYDSGVTLCIGVIGDITKCAREGQYTTGPVSPEYQYGCCEGLETFDSQSGLVGSGLLCYDPEKGVPVCDSIGTKSEGWYYQNGLLLDYENCGDQTEPEINIKPFMASDVTNMKTTVDNDVFVYTRWGPWASGHWMGGIRYGDNEYLDYEESETPIQLEIGLSGGTTYEEQIITITTDNGVVDAYVPYIETTGAPGDTVVLYIVEDGSTYYRNTMYDRPGGKDMTFEESVLGGHLARSAGDVEIEVETCFADPDGRDYYTKGTTTTKESDGNDNIHKDMCVVSDSGKDDYYTEYNGIHYDDVKACEGDNCYISELYCDGNTMVEEVVKCSNSCEDGACMEDPIAQPLRVREIINITTTAIPATQAIDRDGSPGLLFYAGAEKGTRGYSTIGRLYGNGTMVNITERYRDTPIVEQDEILTIGFGTSDETDLINEQVITIETNKGTINVYLPEITGGEATNYWLYISEDGSTFWASLTPEESYSVHELDPIRGWSASMITKHIGRLSPELENELGE
jgi:hypothetical protein